MEFTNWTQKKKQLLGAVAVIAIIGAGSFGYKAYAENEQQKQADEKSLTQLTSDSKRLDELTAELQVFYENDMHVFLAKDVKADKVQAYQLEIEGVTIPQKNEQTDKVKTKREKVSKKKATLLSESQRLASQSENQDQVNALFQKGTAINGATINDQLPIVDGLKKESLPEITPDNGNEWEEAMDTLKNNAMAQLDQIDKATKLVTAFFTKDNVNEKIDDKAVTTAQAEVKKIKNDKGRQALEKRLKEVTDSVAKRKEAEKQAKEAEATAANQAESNAQAVTAQQDVSQGVNTGGTQYQADGQTGANNSPSYQAEPSYTPSQPAGNTGGYGTGGTASGNNGSNSNNGTGGTALPPGYDGHATQEELNQQAEDASTKDWSQDPNSPWYKK